MQAALTVDLFLDEDADGIGYQAMPDRYQPRIEEVAALFIEFSPAVVRARVEISHALSCRLHPLNSSKPQLANTSS
jgi:hypothetical protein